MIDLGVKCSFTVFKKNNNARMQDLIVFGYLYGQTDRHADRQRDRETAGQPEISAIDADS